MQFDHVCHISHELARLLFVCCTVLSCHVKSWLHLYQHSTTVARRLTECSINCLYESTLKLNYLPVVKVAQGIYTAHNPL